MTIAITPFDGLCGFRPLQEITHFLASVPSLRKLVGESIATGFKNTVEASKDEKTNKSALQEAFTALMKNEKSAVVTAAKDLVASAKNEGKDFAGGGGPSNTGSELADLVIRCNSQFEGDIGLFVLFFLNYVKLEVGEAMFLRADDIHAYLSGGRSNYRNSIALLIVILQILSSVWRRQTMSSAPASPQNSKISQPSPQCSHTITRLSLSRK